MRRRDWWVSGLSETGSREPSQSQPEWLSEQRTPGYLEAGAMMNVLYNPPQLMISKTRLLIVAAVLAFALPRVQAASWEEPVATLAKQIAALAGPGPVQLTLSNRSALSADEVPQIRQMLEQDLRSDGIMPGGSD